MTIVLVLAILLPQEQEAARNVLANELSALSSYALRGTGGRDFEGSYMANGRAIRSSDGASISIDVRRVRDGSDLPGYWIDSGPALVSDEPPVAFSGLPIGTTARRSASSGSAYLDTYDGNVFVDVVVSYRGRPTNGGPDWLRDDPTGDLVRCEGLARRVLAKLRGNKAAMANPMVINGVTVSTAVGPRGERLVNLEQYCQAWNLSVNSNIQLGTASFTVGGEQVVIPLAAKKIKDGSQWIESTDISLIKNGKWYVSFAALQTARGQ